MPPGPLPSPEPDPGWPRGAPLILEEVTVLRGGAEVLRDVWLSFDPGQRYVVVGPSGSGKSTLLRLLNRLEDPSSGLLRIGSSPLSDLPVRSVRRGVGLVFQSPRPLPGTLADNLAYPFEVRGARRPEPGALAGAIEEVGLDPSWLDRDASDLSGGERQRLAVAMALAAGPEILALDEPTAALDPASAVVLADALGRRASAEGLRTIVVSHQRDQAARLGDTAVLMEAGRVVEVGPVARVLARADASSWAEAAR